MRLVDADKLYTEIDMGVKASNYLLSEEESCKYANVNDVGDCLEAIKYSDTFDLAEYAAKVRADAVDEMVEGIKEILEDNAIYNIDCIDTLAEEIKENNIERPFEK